MKNWKSTMAFFFFVGVYIFTVFKDREANVLDVTGYIALFSSLFMMLRSEVTVELITRLIDVIGRRDAK